MQLERVSQLQGSPAPFPRRLGRARLALPVCLLAAACSGGATGDEPLDEDGDVSESNGMEAAAGMGSESLDGDRMAGNDRMSNPDAMPSEEPNLSAPDGEDTAADMLTESEPGNGEEGIFVGMTAAHNAVRAGLGLDPPMPDLEWSPEIAAFAQQWSDALAESCGSIAHRDQRLYGENIAMRGSTRLVQAFQPGEAVEGWAAEVACWDFGTINGTESCDAQCAASLFSTGCGHYTQIVWNDSERVGCGYSTCEEGDFTYEIWVCNYDPPGNWVGETPY